MDAKLTLSVDKDVIEKAKTYAKLHKVSLSHIIENYLLTLTQKEKSFLEPSPLIKSLSGVVKLDNDFDHKSDYSDYLNSKYE
jgi:hypothetical protein